MLFLRNQSTVLQISHCSLRIFWNWTIQTGQFREKWVQSRCKILNRFKILQARISLSEVGSTQFFVHREAWSFYFPKLPGLLKNLFQKRSYVHLSEICRFESWHTPYDLIQRSLDCTQRPCGTEGREDSNVWESLIDLFTLFGVFFC